MWVIANWETLSRVNRDSHAHYTLCTIIPRRSSSVSGQSAYESLRTSWKASALWLHCPRPSLPETWEKMKMKPPHRKLRNSFNSQLLIIIFIYFSEPSMLRIHRSVWAAMLMFDERRAPHDFLIFKWFSPSVLIVFGEPSAIKIHSITRECLFFRSSLTLPNLIRDLPFPYICSSWSAIREENKAWFPKK